MSHTNLTGNILFNNVENRNGLHVITKYGQIYGKVKDTRLMSFNCYNNINLLSFFLLQNMHKQLDFQNISKDVHTNFRLILISFNLRLFFNGSNKFSIKYEISLSKYQ